MLLNSSNTSIHLNNSKMLDPVRKNIFKELLLFMAWLLLPWICFSQGTLTGPSAACGYTNLDFFYDPPPPDDVESLEWSYREIATGQITILNCTGLNCDFTPQTNNDISVRVEAVNYMGETYVENIVVNLSARPGLPLADVATSTICTGERVRIGISDLGGEPGVTFTWTAVSSPGITGAQSGSGALINDLIQATASGTITYSITPGSDGCPGPTKQVTINVSPNQVKIFNTYSSELCYGGTTNIYISNPANTFFSWTVDQVGVTGAASGSGTRISQVLTATGSTAGTATYTVTDAPSCLGELPTIIVTVKPDLPAPAIVDAGDRFGRGETNISVDGGGPGYKWYDRNSVIINGQTGKDYSTILEISSTFFVRSTDGKCNGSIPREINPVVYYYPKIRLTGSSGPSSPVIATLASVNVYPRYQWKRNEQDIPGATGATYSATQTGTYTLKIVLPNGKVAESRYMELGPLAEKPQNDLSGIIFEAPPQNVTPVSMNYNRTYVPLVEIPKNALDITGRTKEQVQIVTRYYDGLGRETQSILKQGSHSGNDIINVTIYDNFGRVPRIYLPYSMNESTTSGDFRPNALYEQYNFYQALGNNIANTKVPYSMNRFELSPRNRVLEQAAPGEAWYPGENWQLPYNKTIKSIVSHNDFYSEEDIIVWGLHQGQPVVSGRYSNFELRVNTTIDEEARQVREYKDKNGRTILMRVDDGRSGWAETYYIYDDFGNLRYVLPPEAVKALNTNFEEYYGGTGVLLTRNRTFGSTNIGNTQTYFYSNGATVTLRPNFVSGDGFAVKPLAEQPSQALLSQYAYSYTYDGRNRMIEKRVPGAKPMYMVYDARDRLVLTQDGNQRLENEWTFTKYDALNRPVATGTYLNLVNTTREAIQGLVNAYYDNINIEQEWYESHGNVVHGYDNKSFPKLTDAEAYQSITYYDDYNFPHSANYSFVPTLGHILPFYRVKGQVTGTKTKILDGTNTWLEGVIYYDDRYRIIQEQSKNLFNMVDIVSHRYDFVGKVKETETRHNNRTVIRGFDYDHAGRLTNIWHELVDNGLSYGRKLLVRNEYNELGELIEKNLYSEDDGSTFYQSIDYRYNIRGWLTSINNAQLDGTAVNNDDSSQPTDYWGMELGYNSILPGISATPSFNGNISAVKWSNNLGASQRSYAYFYDPMNRLEGADHQVLGVANTSSFDMSIGDGVTSGYDLNGNILTLTRKDETGTDMDALTYTYVGNQLSSVGDVGNRDTGFRDGNTLGSDYLYDDNGNMTKDLNKSLTSITYNHLNLPERVEKDVNNYILYTYDAAGVKLRQQVYENGNLAKTTDYVGEFIYESEGMSAAEIAFIQHEEGRVVRDATTGNFTYDYRIADHLGNTRVMFTTNPKEVDFTLNYESSTANPDDEAVFSDVGNIIEANVHDHTDAGSVYQRSQRLVGTADAAIGSVLTIPVGPGDRISASVYAKYLAPTANNNPGVAIGTLLAAAINGGTGGTTYEGAINSSYGPSGSIITNLFNDQVNATEPMAFLNLLFLPREGASSIDPGQFTFKQIGSASSNAYALLTLDEPFEAPGAGHVVVYLSNESEVLTEVYFDDLVIMVNEHPVVQTADYYPFGLTHSGGFQRITTPKNNFLYNGFELQTDLDWGVYDYQARYYDPVIGRFLQVDPATDLMRRHSPYNYAFDNPIRFVDPDGMMPGDGIFGGFVSGLATRARKYVANKINEAVVNTGRAIVKETKEFLKDVNVSFYAKADGKITVGPRFAQELEDGTGYDVNVGSLSLVSGGIEVDNEGIQKEGSILGVTDNSETTRGASYGRTVGAIGPVPVSANGGYSEEYQVVDGKTTQVKKEVSASASVTGTPLGTFTSVERTEKSDGSNSTALRVSPFNYGATVGAALVGQFSISVGVKVEHKKDEE